MYAIIGNNNTNSYTEFGWYENRKDAFNEFDRLELVMCRDGILAADSVTDIYTLEVYCINEDNMELEIGCYK